jgi:hypothetical protein
MSITDATGNVTTTWTEQDEVAFTAGTLGTISACVTEVESKLKRGTLSSATQPTNTQVQNWLIFAKQELAEIKNFTFLRRYATATTSASNYIYALPPDYNGGETSLRDTTNDRKISLWPPHNFDLKYPDPTKETEDEPLIATVKNLELWLMPIPNGSYTLELEYTRSGDDNTPTDFSWLPQIERYRCTHYALWQGFLSIHMWNEARLYEMQWKEGLGKAIRADGKRKWKAMQYRAISWQQQYAARHHQSNEEV